VSPRIAPWCYRYLYETPDEVRYAVVQPDSDKGHSFTVPRSDLFARRWVVLGQPQQGVEVRFGGKTQVFVQLADESEVGFGTSFRLSPPKAAPPRALVAALQGESAPGEIAKNARGDGVRVEAGDEAISDSESGQPSRPGQQPAHRDGPRGHPDGAVLRQTRKSLAGPDLAVALLRSLRRWNFIRTKFPPRTRHAEKYFRKINHSRCNPI
jgi:hypothetical protein